MPWASSPESQPEQGSSLGAGAGGDNRRVTLFSLPSPREMGTSTFPLTPVSKGVTRGLRPRDIVHSKVSLARAGRSCEETQTWGAMGECGQTNRHVRQRSAPDTPGTCGGCESTAGLWLGWTSHPSIQWAMGSPQYRQTCRSVHVGGRSTKNRVPLHLMHFRIFLVRKVI